MVGQEFSYSRRYAYLFTRTDGLGRTHVDYVALDRWLMRLIAVELAGELAELADRHDRKAAYCEQAAEAEQVNDAAARAFERAASRWHRSESAQLRRRVTILTEGWGAA